MRNTDNFKNKKVVIVGLARSGLACANLLLRLGADVSVTDNNDNDALRLTAERLNGVKVELGRHSREFIQGNDLLVVSPGVPNDALPIIWAKEFSLPVISEIELAWILCPATVIAVTGTNGKTTVTTLIGKILEVSSKKVFICGNIGNPFSAQVEKMQPEDFVALEVSSFQLQNIKTFQPKISLILNFSRNHLDRHSDMQDYLAAKKRIFMNQGASDYLILNSDCPQLKDLNKETNATVRYFSPDPKLNPNQAAALEAVSILGVDKKIALEVFDNFKGVEHRLEHVKEINRVKFINDSKATTPDATIWALKNIPAPIVLIAGGREKGNDYSLICDLARKKVKGAVLIGEAKDKIEAAFSKFLTVKKKDTLEAAVEAAFLQASPGDCVLFSPMCKSFDMFTDYEQRGRLFKEAVLELAKRNGA